MRRNRGVGWQLNTRDIGARLRRIAHQSRTLPIGRQTRRRAPWTRAIADIDNADTHSLNCITFPPLRSLTNRVCSRN